MEHKQKPDNNFLLQYSGMAFQFLAGIGLAAYAGIYLDRWIKTTFPLFVWLLPLTVIMGIIIKVVKDTKKKQ